MSTKHVKLNRPTNVDLVRNPLIGGSKGTSIAQVTSDELDEFGGANTFEGDIENDTNPQGGIDKAEVRDRRRGPPQNDRDSGPRRMPLQGKKTHEQQLRMLERKPDVPDARQMEEEITRTQHAGGTKTVKREARQSEFPVSRGGLNQESQHNKHNNPGQSGHKPQKPQG
ncbi:hypothetical protein [Bradyrhizobium archetypum]|uniref:hypothetical protein n=1 Tax=Bradyrhizobium archetypum TaxID=2721160 RepID=UPI001F3FEB01|nr:hypothetical protein [Bradyrhizobium archetypum]